DVLNAGANVLNLTGTIETERVYKMAAEKDAAVIICYVQGRTVREVSEFEFATDPVGAMHEYFARAIGCATAQGLERICIDQGLGFYYRNLEDSAARVRFQMQVFLQSFGLGSFGFPICT